MPTFDQEPGVSVTELCENGTRSDTSAEPCTTIVASCTHGTAVAGVVTGDDEDFTGVAPDADIIALRVTAVVEGQAESGDPEFPYSAYIPEAGVLAALEEVYSLRDTHDIAAVNLSLGGAPGLCQDAEWEDVIGRLNDAGIAVVAASGNHGWESSMTFPACLPDVISVGASTSAGEVASFSNTSADLDVLAPGSPITTTVLTSYDASGFAAQQGTSFSAPHVAAAFALLDSEPSRPGGPWSGPGTSCGSSGAMIERPTSNPFDHDPRYAEIRLESIVDFEPFVDADDGYWVEAADWAKVAGVSTGIGGNAVRSRQHPHPGPGRHVPLAVHGFARLRDRLRLRRRRPERVARSGRDVGGVGRGHDRHRARTVLARCAGHPGQLATFMWRTVGEPVPSYPAGFVDVAAGAFYAVAVDWMAEHGLTTGTTPSTFSPDDDVTRAQMVTFEFRLADADQAWTGSVSPPDLALF